MRMLGSAMKTAIAAIGLTLLLATHAHAGDLEVVKAWGLVGKWAENCKAGRSFVTFEESNGAIVQHYKFPSGYVSPRSQIRNAKSTSPTEVSYELDNESMTWKKSDGRIFTFQQTFKGKTIIKDGRFVANGDKAATYEKCS